MCVQTHQPYQCFLGLCHHHCVCTGKFFYLIISSYILTHFIMCHRPCLDQSEVKLSVLCFILGDDQFNLIFLSESLCSSRFPYLSVKRGREKARKPTQGRPLSEVTENALYCTCFGDTPIVNAFVCFSYNLHSFTEQVGCLWHRWVSQVDEHIITDVIY